MFLFLLKLAVAEGCGDATSTVNIKAGKRPAAWSFHRNEYLVGEVDCLRNDFFGVLKAGLIAVL